MAKYVIKLWTLREGPHPGLSEWTLNVITCMFVTGKHWEFSDTYTEDKVMRRQSTEIQPPYAKAC